MYISFHVSPGGWLSSINPVRILTVTMNTKFQGKVMSVLCKALHLSYDQKSPCRELGHDLERNLKD